MTWPLILLLALTDPVEKTQAEVELRRDIPSVGMYMKYFMYTSIDGVPFPPAKLVITYERFGDPGNETIVTTLLVSYYLGWIAGSENGTIIENVTSRLLTKVEVPSNGLLEILYGIYFNQSLPNFTPWWIQTSNISLGSPIRGFNITLQVISEELDVAGRIGTFDIWRAKSTRTNSTIPYDITLLYEKTSGILVAGNLWIFWERNDRSYNETIHLAETNAFNAEEGNEKIKEVIDRSWIAIVLFALVPLALVIFRFSRLRRLEGGLD
ncbi:MAG: hypothetical protein ACE5OZ_03345 [Candidatus Heimdallarchaeota archaeon]